jgi:hypothetical protein
MTIELWGTFSVRDHLVNRAFVADVLLYDQLVIPTLPKDEPESEWPTRWNLAKQRALLGDLGEGSSEKGSSSHGIILSGVDWCAGLGG